MIRRASQAPRFTGFDSRPSDSPAMIAAWASTPPNSRRPWRNGNELKAALGLVAQIVVAGDDLVRDHEIRLDQIPHRQIVADQVLEKLHGLLPQLRACVARELGKLISIRFEHVELAQVQPLRRELVDEPRKAWIVDQPAHLARPVPLRSLPAAARSNNLRSGGPFHRKYDSLDANSSSSSGSDAGVPLFSIRNKNCGDVNTTRSAYFTLS